ncbi:MAG: 4Fe-4S dicluster domain-containing protein [Henriciella sp.]|nr:4Fe-4S dicluster domain-containing protein [Henriciella sp.]
MAEADQAPTIPQILARDALDRLIQILIEREYEVIGPRLRSGAIIYDEIESADQLPIGWQDEQSEGRYRLRKRQDDAVFGFAVGPDSWKKYLRPPKQVLWAARKNEGEIEFEPPAPSKKLAFLGVKPCEVAAIRTLDKVLLGGRYPDPNYAKTRQTALIIAVNCNDPAETCFCTSMQTGPTVESSYDVALTEILNNEGHYFTARSGSPIGASIIEALELKPASDEQCVEEQKRFEEAEAKIDRKLATDGLQQRLAANPNDRAWAEIADRCLSCTNCTQVCPTCFCTSVEDHTSLDGSKTERVQVWDSCFTGRFAELSGGQVRETTSSRYRQWMTHKLSTWIDQFGMSGCVGCGRCISWCPVGIDITKEAARVGVEVEAAP